MKSSTSLAKILTAGVLMAFACAAFAQQSYPSKPIRFIIPYPPGGGTSIVAHLLGQRLNESWGQPVIVDNRPGGNTIIGAEAVVKSPPDGHTILLASSTHVLNPLLLSIPYDAIKDFAPVVTLYSSELVLVLNPSVPANNLQEFIALAKSRPGQLNYASVSAGGTTHLAAESFNIMAGVKTQHINYKGAGPALADLISGQVQLSFAAPVAALAYIKSGRLKAIAISGETRLPALPQVPTFTEAGLPGFDVRLWFGVLAPAGTPKEIVDRLSHEIARIMGMPDMKEKLVGQGLEPFTSTPEQFAALMKADMAKFARIIKTANIKIE
ncbi:MAG: tripartite tricarboxylate transporter substrate binding protein [Betaproteobacteria bacterium]|nr:tripartite tricarboxylate transporter substrate binding protein [Betaproteobacteria bacterium]